MSALWPANTSSARQNPRVLMYSFLHQEFRALFRSPSVVRQRFLRLALSLWAFEVSSDSLTLSDQWGVANTSQ